MMGQKRSISKEDLHALLAGKVPLTAFLPGDFYALVKTYPYFETAYKFYLKRLMLEDQETFQKALKEAATFVNMNEQFWHFLHTPTSPGIQDDDLAKSELIDIERKEKECEQSSELVAQSVDPFDIKGNDSENETLSEVQKETPNGGNITEVDSATLVEQQQEAQSPEQSDTKKYKRKIKDGYEHMGENLAATISSQMDLANPKDDERIQYSPDLYFIDGKDGEGEPLTLADVKKLSASPAQEKELSNGFLEIDESESVEPAKSDLPKKQQETDEQSGELLDIEGSTSRKKSKPKTAEVFDIRDYADQEVAEEGEDLISKFIKSNPRLAPADIEEEKDDPEYVEELAHKSVSENKELVSEPLIEVFIKQGYYEKAIDAFQQLSLNNPEKSAYFARRVKNLKEIIQKHKK